MLCHQPEPSELQEFASWFHQDWKLLFPEFYAGVRPYLRNMPLERKCVLASELRDFIEKNSAVSPEELKQKWLDLGAQGWQASLDIHNALKDFLRMIEEDAVAAHP
jgi:hypothetical protein